MAAEPARRAAAGAALVRRLQVAALRHRVEHADGRVRALLRQRLDALEADIADGPGAAGSDRAPRVSPFSGLMATLDREAAWRDAHAVDGFPARAAWPSLPALDAMRTAWARQRIEQQTRQALAPAHQDAGPLNSASLVHRALRLAHGAAPGYVHHLMAYVDTLSALEQLPPTGDRPATAATTPAKKRARSPRARRR